MLPDYSAPAYWDARYASLRVGGDARAPPFEWLGVGFPELRDVLAPLLAPGGPDADDDREVLILGNGTSDLPRALHTAGCRNVSAVDASEAAVAWAAARFADLPEIDVTTGDATALGEDIPDACFDAVVEKALGDALLCAPTPARFSAMVREAARVLKPGGALVSVSCAPPEGRAALLAAAAGAGAWAGPPTAVRLPRRAAAAAAAAPGGGAGGASPLLGPAGGGDPDAVWAYVCVRAG